MSVRILYLSGSEVLKLRIGQEDNTILYMAHQKVKEVFKQSSPIYRSEEGN